MKKFLQDYWSQIIIGWEYSQKWEWVWKDDKATIKDKLDMCKYKVGMAEQLA